MRVTQRRLRALLDHGLVRARLQGDVLLHRDNIYTLAAAGYRLLEDAGVEPELARPGRVPHWRALPHASAIRDVFAAFCVAERDGLVVLKDVLFEGDLVRVAAFKASGLVPDALVVLTTATGERHVAIEVDLGSEPTRILKLKLEKYRSLHAADVVHEVLFVLAGPRPRLAELASDAGLLAAVRCTLRDELANTIRNCSLGPYAPPVRAVRTPETAQLRALPRIVQPTDAALTHRFVRVVPAGGGA